MGKRIYEIAKEIGKSSNEIIDVLKKNNIEKTNFSGVDAKEMDIITKAFAKKQEAPVKKEQPKQAVLPRSGDLAMEQHRQGPRHCRSSRSERLLRRPDGQGRADGCGSKRDHQRESRFERFDDHVLGCV